MTVEKSLISGSITKEGKGVLEQKTSEWNEYKNAVSSVLAFSW